MRSGIMLAAVAAILASPVSAQDFDREKDRLFVTGVGKIEVVPDVAVVTLTAESRHPDWAAANERARTVAAAVREEIRKAGIEEADVRTLGVNVNPIMEYDTLNVPKVVGYQSHISVQVKVREAGKTGPLIDAAVQAGATNVSGPYFEISEPEKVEREARKLAMKDARQRAEDLAEAGGFEISGVVSVSDNGDGNVGRPYPMMMARAEMAMAAAPAPATEVSAGTQEVSVTVSAIYGIWNDPEIFRQKP